MVTIHAYSTNTCALRVDGAVFCWGDNTFGQIGDGGNTDSFSPVAVPSFSLNINPTVTSQQSGREAIVNIIATCEEGDRLQVKVSILQGSTEVGKENDHFDCAGSVTQYPVVVRARGNGRFQLGAAVVEASAVIRDRGVHTDQEWTRAVQIVAGQ